MRQFCLDGNTGLIPVNEKVYASQFQWADRWQSQKSGLKDDAILILASSTIGYEGRSLDDFSKELKSNGIKRLVDVREIAQSRKTGFSSKRMSQDLPSKGIEYLHVRPLGSPKTLRDELRETGDFGKFADAYRKHLELNGESLNALLRKAIEKPTALMCYERESTRCHRSIIASRLAGLGFIIIDL